VSSAAAGADPSTKWPVAEIVAVSLRPSTPLAASKMLDAGPVRDALFSLPDGADDSETPSPYVNDRPLEWRLRARWTAAVFGPRKVRTPQGTVLGNSQAGQPDGKCSRKQTADGLRTQARLKRWCKRPPVHRVTGAACKPHRVQGQAGINCPLNIPGRPLERIGDIPPRWMVVPDRIRLTGGLAACRGPRKGSSARCPKFCRRETIMSPLAHACL
jgi:hypothetical protein